MKQTNKIICTVFLLTILTIFGGVFIVHSSILTAQDKTLVLIEDVLPFDSKQYSIVLRTYSVPELPDLGVTQPVYGEQEVLTYALESNDSTVDVICTIQNNILTACSAYVVKGPVIIDRQYSNVTDAATSFLQKYESYTKMDSTEMIDMLSKVDSTENATITSGTLKLIVTHQDLSGTWFGDVISFRWVHTFNGCDYLAIEVDFRDGVFSGLIDHRQLYAIGDTSVNISEEQAIKIALETIKNYSYSMSDDWNVTGFDVIEDKAVANLWPQRKEANILYPAWSVILPLDGVWPGSVRELLVVIWAGSGEVDHVHHQAYGGADFLPDDTSGSYAPTDPTVSSTDNGGASTDTITIVIVVAAVVITAGGALFIKKRSK